MKFIIIFTLFALSFAAYPTATECSAIVKFLEGTDGTTDSKKVFATTDVIKCLEKLELKADVKNKIVTSMKTFMEGYVLKDILKNPPQPDGKPNYYEKLDIDTTLNEIEKKAYTNFYDFYIDIQNMIIKTRDSHLSLGINGNGQETYTLLQKLSYLLPFDFKIEGSDFYIVPHGMTEYFTETVSQAINNHKSVKVEKINNEEPAEFLRKFAQQFVGLKSPHAQFTNAKTIISEGVLASSPLTKEFLQKNIVVKYLGKEGEATYNYGIMAMKPGKRSQRAQAKIDNYLNKKTHTILTLEDLIETEEEYQRKQALKQATPSGRFAEEGNDIYCYINNEKKVNTLVLTTYSPADSLIDKFLETAKKCIEEFDKNIFPIQIIMSQNSGGLANLEQFVQKSICPYNDVNVLSGVRISDYSKKILFELGYGEMVIDTDTCKAIDLSKSNEWYAKSREIKYGDVVHKVTKVFGDGFSASNMVKMKNIRKPTEIVLYTDSYCFSSCSVTAKGMNEHGSAILVGYNGDPTKPGTDNFEVGQSPTAIVTLNTQFKNAKKTFDLEELGISVGLSFAESYKYKYSYDESVPKEYVYQEIDERSKFNIYNDNMLGEFTENTLALVTKYKTQCNPKNKRLVLVDAKCNAEAQKLDKHALGGYECGSDGKWSSKCVIAHCEYGYKFDYYNKKCIPDVCDPPKNADPSTPNKPSGSNNNGSEMMNILFMMIMIIALMI